jgi:5-methylcytosine-specific restriction endonuclease McrA
MSSMARPKLAEQAKARLLRAEGWSVRRIAHELGISISSASVWTSDIEPPRRLAPVQLAAGAEPIETARCPRCQRTLPLSSFHRQQSQCKDCRREYIRARGDLHRRQTSAARDKRRAAARRLVAELLLAGRCTDCGLADPLVLEFDHVGPKRAEVGLLVREGYRLSKIVEEIANCELVCANCHRRRTGLRARSWRIDPDWRAAGESRPLRKRNLQFIVDYLQGAACVDCGERDPVVLDFDHVGAKRDDVVQLAYREYSIASLEREIAECQIRCANCHRRSTIEQQGHFRHHLLQPL